MTTVMTVGVAGGPSRDPNPDSMPSENDRGSVEQIDDVAPGRGRGVEDTPADPADGGVGDDPA